MAGSPAVRDLSLLPAATDGGPEQRVRNTLCWTLGGAPPRGGWTGQRVGDDGTADSGQRTADSGRTAVRRQKHGTA